MATKSANAENKKSAGKVATEEPKRVINNRNAKKAKRESFSAWEGHMLTSQEARFIDDYCITGKGRQSVINA